MGKQKRFRKERAEKATDALLAEGTPSRPKWYYLVLRLVNVFFGCVAICGFSVPEIYTGQYVRRSGAHYDGPMGCLDCLRL